MSQDCVQALRVQDISGIIQFVGVIEITERQLPDNASPLCSRVLYCPARRSQHVPEASG